MEKHRRYGVANAMNEQQLIDRYFKGALPQGAGVQTGIGDDAAVLAGSGRLVMSMDTLVEGRHFRVNEEPSAVGHKSLAVNLSDLAAMGSTPRWAMLSLSLPENTPPEWVQSFAQGFLDLAQRWQVTLIGGDLVRGPLVVTVQVTGEIGSKDVLLRSGAQVGDKIYLTGDVGGAGLAWHRPDCLRKDATAAALCLERLQRPVPRLDEGLALTEFATAAIDVSDGVLLDLSRLLTAGRVGAVLNWDAVPLMQGLEKLLDEDDFWLPLTSGDDYELLFTVPPERETAMYAAMKRCGTPVTEIGHITADKRLCCLRDGAEVELPEKLGFDHFDD